MHKKKKKQNFLYLATGRMSFAKDTRQRCDPGHTEKTEVQHIQNRILLSWNEGQADAATVLPLEIQKKSWDET